MSDDWLDQIRWNVDGLIPVIAQAHDTGKVLMLAWMNREALMRTRETGQAVYWSRSKRRLWQKGERSGHVQRVRRMRIDCDRDALLIEIEQHGGVACHTGRQSCFFHELRGENWIEAEPVLKDPQDIYA